jgi:hypothetical protein
MKRKNPPQINMNVIAEDARSRTRLVTDFDFSPIYKHIDIDVVPPSIRDSLRSFLDPNTIWEIGLYPDERVELFACVDDCEITIDTSCQNNRRRIEVSVWRKNRHVYSRLLCINAKGHIIRL